MRGFTLVELLVIVGIIALLAGLLLPALNHFIIQSSKAKTQAAINLIDGACQHYFTDFDDYPPSHDSNYSGWTGSELLVLFLTGYGPDAGNDGIPGADLSTDDGMPEYGFRLKQRGYVYGLYGVENLRVHDGGGRPEFVDTFGAFGNPILYYRWTGSNYDGDHNNDGPGELNSYAKDSDGAYYRTDFILISKGHNQEWNAPSDMNSDDVTNFFNE
ncbi:MAG: hypothetical protein KAV00_18170 [Phycisphaerae bacterium]|nr:hypothetical protein [Phycisphaerae bacterium]